MKSEEQRERWQAHVAEFNRQNKTRPSRLGVIKPGDRMEDYWLEDGLPSRAEITDAAMGERAECVMLNKGPYVVEAVRALDDILRRMQSHQSKKRSMLRPLKLADHFIASSPLSLCTTRR